MPDASTAYGKILELANDDKFTAFQNSVTSAVYDELGQGYAANENEVALVKRLVEATQNQSYNNSVKLHAAMLHGSRSYVEFDYLDKRVTKELGDMAVIAVVTTSKKRLFQRICIIQNKKTRKNGWDIDLEQLFLLKNFPPFTGSKGIFSGYRDLAFRNSSGSLGAFGLMHAPGEMLVVAAPLLPEFLRGKKTVPLADISAVGELLGPHGFPFWAMGLPFHHEEWFHMVEEMSRHYGFPIAAASGAGGHSVLSNTRFTRDIYDFIRSWTHFSLGEVTCVGNHVVNKPVDGFANFLMKKAGLGGEIEFPKNDTFGDQGIEGSMAVLVAHVEIGTAGE